MARHEIRAGSAGTAVQSEEAGATRFVRGEGADGGASGPDDERLRRAGAFSQHDAGEPIGGCKRLLPAVVHALIAPRLVPDEGLGDEADYLP
jgi:hypothetical protein